MLQGEFNTISNMYRKTIKYPYCIELKAYYNLREKGLGIRKGK